MVLKIFFSMLTFVLSFSSGAWSSATWKEARTVFVAGSSYRAMYEYPAKKVSGDWAKPDLKYASLVVAIHLTNISPIAQTVKVVLGSDSESGGGLWNHQSGRWHAWGQYGFFLALGNVFSANTVGAGFSSNNIVDHSLGSRLVSGDIVLAAYDKTAPSNNMQTVNVVYYQGGNINPPAGVTSSALVDKSFARAKCAEFEEEWCHRSNIYFTPQIQISVKEDRGAVLAAASFANMLCTGALAIGFSNADVACNAQVNGPPMWVRDESPSILINGGRPF